MPNTFNLDEIAAVLPGGSNSPIQAPVAPPFGAPATPAPAPAPKADFNLADVVQVDTPATPAPAPKANFNLADIVKVDSAPAPTGYTLDKFRTASEADLIKDKEFMPVQFGKSFVAGLTPQELQKLERVYKARETSGTTLKDKFTSAVEGIGPALHTLKEGAVSGIKAARNLSPAGLAEAINDPRGPVEGIKQKTLKTAGEVAASVELAGIGTEDLLRRSGREIKEGVTGSKANMTDQEWRQRFFNDVSAAEQVEKVGKGNGALMQAVGIDADKLKAAGIELNPQEIEKLSAVTDPVNFIPFGATVGFVSKVGGKVIRGAIAKAVTAEQAAILAKTLNGARDILSEGASVAGTLTGEGVKLAGEAVEKTGQAAEKAVRAVGGTASGLGLGGILGGDIYSALGGAAVAKGAPRVIQATGRAIQQGGKVLKGEAELGLLGKTASGVVSGAVKGAAEGAVLALPFEIGARPEEEGQVLGMVGVGALARGGMEGAAPAVKATAKAAQNRLAETVFRKFEQSEAPPSPAYGTDPVLDSVHTATFDKVEPAGQKLVNWGRELLREAGGEIYVVDGPTFQKETGRDALGYAVKAGERTQPDGTVKPVFQILLNSSAEALPHEFFHALEDLDPHGAKALKDAVAQSLTPEQLKAFEQLYNSRINGGLPESKWTYRLNPEKVVGEASAEVFSRLLLAQDLSGVSSHVTQKAATFVSGLLEKLGAPLGGVNLEKGPGVSSLGVRPNADAAKVGQAWVQNLVKRVNEEGTLGQPPKRFPLAGIQNPGEITFETPISRRAETVPFKAEDVKPVTPPPAEGPITPTPKAPPTPPPAEGPAPAKPPVMTATPPPPAETPTSGLRNIRAKRAEQNDFAGKRAEVTNVDKALAAATDDADKAMVETLAPHVEKGTVLEIAHEGVKSEKDGAGRSTRRTEQETAYIAEGMGAAPRSIRETYQKVFVPVRFEVVGGKPQLLAMSMDKVIANVHRSVKDAAEKGVASKIPYEVTDGKLTDNAWGQVVDDLQSYNDNQANGYRGDGQPLTRPTKDIGISIPAENPAYNPVKLSEEKMNFLNLVQGLNPPLTARETKGAVPGNVKGAVLADINRRPGSTPSVIRPEDVKKQTFKTSGRDITETNPLRNELAAAGVPVRELIEVTERLNVKDISSVTPREDLHFNAPVTDTIRGGFMPALAAIEEAKRATPDEWHARFSSGEPLTKQAYKLGLDLKSKLELDALLSSAEEMQAKSRELMVAKDFQAGMDFATKAQFFREAYEAATDTGSAATSKGWRKDFSDRTPPFAKGRDTQGSFMPQTEAGRKLLEDGFDVEHEGNFGIRSLKLKKDGVDIGSVSSSLTGEDTATISLSSVRPEFRGKGLGEVMYRELLSQLKEDGVKYVDGMFVAPEPLAIRKKIFGGVEDLTLNGEPVDIETAMKVAPQIKTASTAMALKGRNRLDGDVQFLPRAKENKVGPAWEYPKEQSLDDVFDPVALRKKTTKPARLDRSNPTAWILPDGTVAPLKTSFHENDLAANSTEYNKRFGTKFSDDASSIDRLDALAKGFVRLRYRDNGTMVVEASAAHWGKQRKAVTADVLSKADKIDTLQVNLFDKNGTVISSEDGHVFRAKDKAAALKEILDDVTPSELTRSKHVSEVQRARAFTVDPDALEAGGQFSPAKLDSAALEDFTSPKTIGKALKKPGWAILTATQESLGNGTDAVNVKANKALQKTLEDAGFDFKKVEGFYKGVNQGDNFLVTGITPDEALRLGKQFSQESVLVPEGMLYHDGTLNPVSASDTVIGNVAETQDFFSKVDGGPAFSLGIDFNSRVPFKELSGKFSPRFISAPDGVPDVLDAIHELGGVQSVQKAKFREGGEWDGYNDAFGTGIARLLRRNRSGRGLAPDELVNALRENYGMQRIESVDDLYTAVERAAIRRQKLGQNRVSAWDDEVGFSADEIKPRKRVDQPF